MNFVNEGISSEIALRWMTLDLSVEKSIFILVMALWFPKSLLNHIYVSEWRHSATMCYIFHHDTIVASRKHHTIQYTESEAKGTFFSDDISK